jgi:hypothetical protein
MSTGCSRAGGAWSRGGATRASAWSKPHCPPAVGCHQSPAGRRRPGWPGAELAAPPGLKPAGRLPTYRPGDHGPCVAGRRDRGDGTGRRAGATSTARRRPPLSRRSYRFCGQGVLARVGWPCGRNATSAARSQRRAVCWLTPLRWPIWVVLNPSAWYSRTSSSRLGAWLERPGSRRGMLEFCSHCLTVDVPTP